MRFISAPMGCQPNEFFVLYLAIEGENVPWPPKTNVITHKLRRAEEIVESEAMAVAIMTRAMRNNWQVDKKIDGKKKY